MQQCKGAMVDWLALSTLPAWVVIENQLWTPFAKYAKVLPKMIGIEVRELKGKDPECQQFYQIGSDLSSQKWGVESAHARALDPSSAGVFYVLLLLLVDTWFLIRWTWISGSPRSIQAFSGTRTVTRVFLILRFLVSLRKQLLVSNILGLQMFTVGEQPAHDWASQSDKSSPIIVCIPLTLEIPD